jgi:DNA-directed RNA polymerase subunit RPC12/RpoP
MECCTRCGKQLEWLEQKMAFWNKQLKKGVIRWYVIGSRDMGKRREFPQYAGKKLCQICVHEVFTDEITMDASTDFAGLQVFLKQNKIVMSAYNCPKCNGMVDIPKSGKLLICNHCGNPLKPIDIHEKIKTLLT